MPSRQLFRPFRGAGQESPPQGAVRDQTDSKLQQRRQNPVLDVALPKRILALQYGDGLRGMGASDGLVARFGKAEIKNLAFADQVLHCAGDVLDWHARVHAMLIQQVDVIGLEGRLFSPWRSLSANPNFVAIVT